MFESNQTGAFRETLIAQPENKLPIISKKNLKKGIVEEGKTIGIWFTDIGKNLWETAKFMDTNAKINLDNFKGAVYWTITINTLYFSVRMTSKQYYLPVKGQTVDPVAIKLEFIGSENMITEYLRRFLAYYDSPPYDFRREKNMEKSFENSVATIRNKWDQYYGLRYEAISESETKVADLKIEKEKKDKVGKWFKDTNLMKIVANVVLISSIIIPFVVSPIITYAYTREINDLFFNAVLLNYIMGIIILVLMVIPFWNLILNYRVGFHRRSYQNLDSEKGNQTIKDILNEMRIPFAYQEKFVMSHIFRHKGSLITLERNNLKIISQQYNQNPRLSLFLVSIGKIDETNEAFALNFEARLDKKLVEFIR